MTRFARAKGSKASNERVAEEATPWQDMKQQILEKKRQKTAKEDRKEADAMRMKNYEAFLDEEKRGNGEKGEWSEFPQSVVYNKQENKKKKKNKEAAMKKQTPEEKRPKQNKLQGEGALSERKGVKRKAEDYEEVATSPTPKKKRRNKKKENLPDNVNENGVKNIKAQKSLMKKKKKPVVAKKDKSEMSEEEAKKFERNKRKRLRQLEKKKKFKAEKLQAAQQGDSNKKEEPPAQKPNRVDFEIQNKPVKKAKQLDRSRKERVGRKPDKIDINGKEVTLRYYDGFPIKEEDYVRLTKLKREMISRGLPRSEIQNALKLERRRAEKALAREKKNVCFKCRKSGHNLSECPELESGDNNNGGQFEEAATSGVCFKCGSTEHTRFACRVVQGDVFKFAKCFVCGDQGHISRQCPDNPRGLYPKGGACKLCGDVTHLKKDCPALQARREEENRNASAETIDEANLESLEGEQHGAKIADRSTAKKPRHIKF